MEEQKPKNLTPTQIYAFTGVPIRTISDWKTKGIIPMTSDMSTIVKAIIKFESGKAAVAIEPEDEELDGLKLKLAKYDWLLRREQWRKERLKNDLDEGNLVLASEVAKLWQGIVMAIRSKLDSIPDGLSYSLIEQDNPNIIKGILRLKIDEILAELGGLIDGNQD